MLHEDITKKILKACFEVINELGSGFLESVYEKALLIALKDIGLNAHSQVPLTVQFRGVSVGDFYADILVEDKIILELKAVTKLVPEHKAQLINYLKATKMQIGLLINFGNPKLEFTRLYRQKNTINKDTQDGQDINEEPCGRDRRVSSVSDRNSLLFILVPIHPCLKRQGINGTFR